MHVFSVPGVVNANGFGTLFTCSSASSSDTTLGVEVFGPAGGASLNDADATSLVVPPSGTVRFATTPTAQSIVDGHLVVPTVLRGSARVLATTSKGLLCSAFLADAASVPTTSMVSLPVVRKTTQQGD